MSDRLLSETLNAAGIRISQLLREEWTIRGSSQSDGTGLTNFRGFFGVYSLDISLPGGRQITREARFSKSGDTELALTN